MLLFNVCHKGNILMKAVSYLSVKDGDQNTPGQIPESMTIGHLTSLIKQYKESNLWLMCLSLGIIPFIVFLTVIFIKQEAQRALTVT